MDAAAASRARGTANGIRSRVLVVVRSCDWCGVSLEGRSPKARSCSRDHRHLAYKRAHMIERQRQHPRCPICMGPIPFRLGNGQRWRTTCSKRCSRQRWRWFGNAAA